MGTINLDYIYFNYFRDSEKDTLASFAREDGCYRIYKFAMQPGGRKDHALPVRSERDEQAMFGSQHVYDPVCIWPASERSEPLHTNLQMVELEGNSLEDVRQKVPAGYEIIVEQILTAGGQRTAIGRGKTKIEAHQKALFYLPKEAQVLSDNLIVDYEQSTIQVKAFAEKDAREIGAAAAKEKGLKEPGFDVRLAALEEKNPLLAISTIRVEAADEQAALALGQAAAKEKAFDDPHITIRLTAPGKKGFLGIGAKLNQYEVDIVQPAFYEVDITQLACVEIVYTQNARIKAVIGH